MLREAGFADAELVAETGFNSSPVTRGVLLRAKRPAISDAGRFAKAVDLHVQQEEAVPPVREGGFT